VNGDAHQVFSTAVDPVTGLQTRDAFITTVDAGLAGLEKRGESGALVYIDIDRMRAINGAHGRATGDAILAAMAKSLSTSLGEGTTLSRDAGDAFAAFLPNVEAFFARMAAEEMLSAAAAAGQAAGGVSFTVSIGVALYPQDARDAEFLLAAGRLACRSAFESGSNRAVEVSQLGPPTGLELLLDRLPCPDYVDRQREFDVFTARLGECAGSVGYLFVRGEAGVGKSRLIAELAKAARAQGVACASAHCWPPDLQRPYAPLIRAVVEHADATLDNRELLLSEKAPEEIAELAPLFRRYGVAMRDLGVEANPEVQLRRETVFLALASLVEAQTHGGPLCVFFDEANWLDAASMELLSYAGQRSKAGILVCAVLNDLELLDAHGQLRPAPALWEARSKHAGLWELRLGRLSLSDSGGMTSSILVGRQQSPEFDRAVYGACAGNPLFHESALRSLAIAGAIRSSARGWQAEVPAGALPRTLDALLDATCSPLPTDMIEAGAAIAAAASPVGADVLSLALGCSESEAVGYIDELTHLRLVKRAGPGTTRVVPATTRVGERMAALVGEDFLEVAHVAYADHAARLRGAGLSTHAVEAYHRGRTLDEPASESAAEAAAAEYATLFSAAERPQETVSPADARPKPSPEQLSVRGQAALADLVVTLSGAIRAARESPDLDPISLPSTDEFLEALSRVIDDIEVLTITTKDGGLLVNGRPAGTGGIEEAFVADALARSGAMSVSIARSARNEEIAPVLHGLSQGRPPDWARILDDRNIQTIAVGGEGLAAAPEPQPSERKPSTRRFVPFEAPEQAGPPEEPLTRPSPPEPEPAAPTTSAPPAPTASPPPPDEGGRPVLDSLEPAKILDVEGIPPGGDPIRVGDDEAAGKVLDALDDLLDRNERSTAAAICWRVFAGFELATGAEMTYLAAFLERLEPRVWRTRLTETHKALESILVTRLRNERDREPLLLVARSAARSTHAFLLAQQYGGAERLSRVVVRLAADESDRHDPRPTGDLEEATRVACEVLASTDFHELLMADLASETPARSQGAASVLRQVAGTNASRLVDTLRMEGDYRIRRAVGEALGASEGGGVPVIAQLDPTMPPQEYANIISIVDVLGLEPSVAEEVVVEAINHTSDAVRREAVSVAYRLPSSSALGVLQRSVNAGGTLGALRTLQAIGELRLAEALPIIQKQLMDSQDAAVIEAGCRAMGRMAGDSEIPSLRVVRLLGGALEKLPTFADKDEAERAALTALWSLGQYSIPEAQGIISSAQTYPSAKVAAFAASVLSRRAEGTEQR